MHLGWMQHLRGLSINMRFWLVIVIIFLAGLPFAVKAAPGCFPKDENLVGPSVCPGLVVEECQKKAECKWYAEDPATPPPSNIDTKETIKLDNPLGTKTDIAEIVGSAINKAMGVMGSLALVVFVYGGFRWLTAAGNSESVEAGTGAMVWATIGIFIIFASYAILQLVFNVIGAQSAPAETKVTGGVSGNYCLVHCMSADTCMDVAAASAKDLAAKKIKCTYKDFSTESKKCTEVAVCK